MDKSVVMVAGEDVESEDDEFDRPTALLSLRNQLVVSGEAPESDVDDFGSTVSLGTPSPEPRTVGGSKKLPLDPKPLILHPADRLKLTDPALYKKHLEKNKSLRHNFLEKALRPTLLQNIKKLDTVSQGISNIQMATQEVLMQSRLITENLNLIRVGIGKFQETDREISNNLLLNSTGVDVVTS